MSRDDQENMRHVQVRLPADMLRRLDALAVSAPGGAQLTRSQVLRQALGYGVVMLERDRDDQSRRAKQMRIPGT